MVTLYKYQQLCFHSAYMMHEEIGEKLMHFCFQLFYCSLQIELQDIISMNVKLIICVYYYSQHL